MAKDLQIPLEEGDTEKSISEKLKKVYKQLGIKASDSERRKTARQILKDHFDKDGKPKKKR